MKVPWRADDLDRAAHEAGQVHRDREAEAGAAVFARGRAVGLFEGAEESRDFLFGYADTFVADGEPDFILHAQDRQGDRAMTAELDGVRKQVDEDLAGAHRVADDPFGQVRARAMNQFQPFFTGAIRHERNSFRCDFGQVVWPIFNIQLACFDLGKVEDVVDQAQQVGAGIEDAHEGFTTGRILAVPGADAGETLHGGERRADFVTYVGEKMTFRIRGRFSRQPGFASLVERGDQMVGKLIDVRDQMADLGVFMSRGNEEAAAGRRVNFVERLRHARDRPHDEHDQRGDDGAGDQQQLPGELLHGQPDIFAALRRDDFRVGFQPDCADDLSRRKG